jgi:molybdate transport system substrate-binding protein
VRPTSGIIAGLLACLFCAAAQAAQTVAIAAAANLTFVLKPLNAAFAAGHPAVAITAVTASSGNLVAMITNGAPYDVFLSADMDYPRKLIEAGGADESSLITFTYGKLALWTTRAGFQFRSVEEAVGNTTVRKIAIANPRTAPYGRAALEVLSKLGLESAARPKLIIGEDISITAQYVSSGNADLGFVALSLLLSPRLKAQGRWIEIPTALYAPIAQGAVLTKRGETNAAARAYLRFLASPAARQVFQRFGYGLP